MNPNICIYQNKLWVVVGVDAKSNKLIIALPDSGKVLLADTMDVRFLGAEDLIDKNPKPASQDNSQRRQSSQDSTDVIKKDISHKLILDVSIRYLAITMDIEGGISPRGAAEMCDLSLSRYHQMKRLYDPQVCLRAFVSERRGRKKKNLKPQPTTNPTSQSTPHTAETPTTPTRKGR